MKAALSLGPFDTVLRQPLTVTCGIDGGLAVEAAIENGIPPLDARRLFEGATPEEGAGLASRICACHSVAHSLAFSLAVEEASGIEVPEGQQALRVFIAEYERIACHLAVISDIGRALDDDILFGVPRKYISRIRRCFRRSFGNPFCLDSIVPGGVTVGGEYGALEMLGKLSGPLLRDTAVLDRKLALDGRRLAGAKLVLEPHEHEFSAPTFRAGGSGADVRARDDASGYYREIERESVVRKRGLSLDRASLLLEEIAGSLDIIDEVRGVIGAEPGTGEGVRFAEGSVSATCESACGAVEYRVRTGRDGALAGVGLSTGAAEVLERIPSALSGVPYEDVAASIISFSPCAACVSAGS